MCEFTAITASVDLKKTTTVLHTVGQKIKKIPCQKKPSLYQINQFHENVLDRIPFFLQFLKREKVCNCQKCNFMSFLPGFHKILWPAVASYRSANSKYGSGLLLLSAKSITNKQDLNLSPYFWFRVLIKWALICVLTYALGIC